MTPHIVTNEAPIQLVECPRDAMQGWSSFIPTADKVRYLNTLLQVGFHTLDFGSFVSPKAIPQMADTPKVLAGLQLEGAATKLLAIVANRRGAEAALAFPEISYLGFPFSISPTFQQRNANSNLTESLLRVEEIQDLCVQHNRELVIYLSMGFGNPYGDPYSSDILLEWADAMVQRDVKIISLADTVGLATPQQVETALTTLIPKYPDTTIGVHLHAAPDAWHDKLEAAVQAGCQRIDGALKGIGGCPMAQNTLIGNMATENIISYLDQQGKRPFLAGDKLSESMALAAQIFAT